MTKAHESKDTHDLIFHFQITLISLQYLHSNSGQRIFLKQTVPQAVCHSPRHFHVLRSELPLFSRASRSTPLMQEFSPANYRPPKQRELPTTFRSFARHCCALNSLRRNARRIGLRSENTRRIPTKSGWGTAFFRIFFISLQTSGLTSSR